MEATQTYTLTFGQADITNGVGLPATFVQPISLQLTHSGFETVVSAIPYRELDARYPDSADTTLYSNNVPRYWYLYGNTIKVFPAPNVAYTATLRYRKEPTALTLDADVPELPSEFEELLIYGATYRVWEIKDRLDKSAVFENKYRAELAKFANRYTIRQDGEPQFMASPRRRVNSATSIL